MWLDFLAVVFILAMLCGEKPVLSGFYVSIANYAETSKDCSL